VSDLRGRVLIIDDDEAACRVLRQFLNQAGYEVLGAPDGRHALELLEAGLEPDLLVLDLMIALRAE
jgi:CheY-like chemotaxis protein